MKGKGVRTDLLRVSEATARLEAGMYGNFNRPEPIISIKKSEPRLSVNWGPQREHAARLIDKAIMKGDLSVYVTPHSMGGKSNSTLLQIPIEVIGKMIRTRGGLPDHAIRPEGLPCKGAATRELFGALSQSALYLRRCEFDAWYAKAKSKRRWPSQILSKKSRMGRPSKQTGELRDRIIALVNDELWSAQRNSIADLVRLLKPKGETPSRQTLVRMIEQLHRETGERHFHTDQHKEPGDLI